MAAAAGRVVCVFCGGGCHSGCVTLKPCWLGLGLGLSQRDNFMGMAASENADVAHLRVGLKSLRAAGWTALQHTKPLSGTQLSMQDACQHDLNASSPSGPMLA